MNRWIYHGWLVLLGLLAACRSSSDNAADEELPVPYTDAGTIELEERFRLGDDTDVIFGNVQDLAVDRQGRIYVADGEYLAVRIFSSEGDSLGSVGNKGEGPGEFTSIDDIVVGPMDSLFVFDRRQDRVTVFSPGLPKNLSYTRSLADVTDEGSVVGLLKPDTTGLLLKIRDVDRTEPMMEGTARLVWADLRGDLRRDSLLMAPAREMGYMNRDGMAIMLYLPFGREPIFRIGDDNTLYYGWTDSTTVDRFSWNGQKLERVRLRPPTLRVPEEEVDAYRQRYDGRLKEAVGWYVDEYGLSRTYPPMTDFVVDDDKRLWIGLTDTTASRWKVVGSERQSVASCSLPKGTSIKTARNGRIYAVRERDSGIQEVAVYRLRHVPV